MHLQLPIAATLPPCCLTPASFLFLFPGRHLALWHLSWTRARSGIDSYLPVAMALTFTGLSPPFSIPFPIPLHLTERACSPFRPLFFSLWVSAVGLQATSQSSLLYSLAGEGLPGVLSHSSHLSSMAHICIDKSLPAPSQLRLHLSYSLPLAHDRLNAQGIPTMGHGA